MVESMNNISIQRAPIKKTWLKKHYPQLISFIILLIITFFMLIPIFWGIVGSFRSSADFVKDPSSFFATSFSEISFKGYEELFSHATYNPEDPNSYYPIWNWLLNSLIVALGGTLLYLVIASLAAYAFVFLDFKYNNLIFAILLGTMTIPGIISMTPQLINMNLLGLYGQILGLIVPSLGGVYGVFLIKQFFTSIPKDLVENARMDGASNPKIFLEVVLPLGKSALFVQGLFGFMSAWNDIQWTQLVVGWDTSASGRLKWTLAYGLKYISNSTNSADLIPLSLASAVITMIPIFIVYMIAQSKIIEGVANTGVKK